MLDAAAIRHHVKQIEEVGYSIVEDAIEPDFVTALADDLARLETVLGVGPATNLFEGNHTVRIYNLLAHGPLYARIPVHDHVLPIVEKVLDKGCLVSSLSSIAIDPGQTAQPLHADDQLIPLPKPHVPTVCNTMWAITDFTADNGATRVVPGSHKRGSSPNPFDQVDGIVAAEMKRGSVLIYHGSLWHQGGANSSESRRVGVAMNYCAGWIRQQENQQLGIPRDVAAQFPVRLRELCGYRVYRGVIGHVDRRSPMTLLDPKADPNLGWDQM